MDLAKLTNILDMLAGISAAPEIIGKERLKAFEERLEFALGGGGSIAERWFEDYILSFLSPRGSSSRLYSVVQCTWIPLTLAGSIAVGLGSILLFRRLFIVVHAVSERTELSRSLLLFGFFLFFLSGTLKIAFL